MKKKITTFFNRASKTLRYQGLVLAQHCHSHAVLETHKASSPGCESCSVDLLQPAIPNRHAQADVGG